MVAFRQIAEGVQDRYPEIPWRQIIGMRNVIAHDYLGIRLSRVFETATAFIPNPIARLPAIIAEIDAG